ncbi:type II toxin-antitoxin system death-on-curing family toxin [Nocardia caishijiensis]|uniref:Death-on-curing protein n=1 Tax=Nocardia caishijiensis TaxID=184756 RepID=A0ABQ6YUA5_9NOCA|nr:Fic family protein [Nocardia caishijiensis]KAF0849390.1 death-on-curing protein [Nocardia caishijiensis]
MRPEALIKCNQRVTEGRGAIRDLGLVAAAATRPDQIVLGQQAYPTPELKSAAVFQSVIRDRPFIEGNQMTAWVAVRLLLGCYGLAPGVTGDALVALIDTIASEQTEVAWLASQLEVEPRPE